MAGHSKFANIKRKKEKNDAQRGRVFTRLGREIAVAVKHGGSDEDMNPRLRDAVAKAKSENMPNDTIDRAIKKAAGELDSVNYEEMNYEGYGPSGVAIIVEALTDNRNRTAAKVREAFTKGGGNLGTTGCVSFMFDRKGLIMVEKSDKIDEDELMMLALEGGCENFEIVDEGYEIITEPKDFSKVRETLEEAGIEMISAEIEMIPQNYTDLEDEDDIKKMDRILSLLEDEDDVQNVYHNWEGIEE